MIHFFRYALGAAIGAAGVALISILWPKFIDKPEPKALDQVRNTVLGTEIGQRAAALLGATNDAPQPLNLSDTVSSFAGTVTSSVEQKVSQIVSDQVAAQVIKQYQQLPIIQQDHVVEMICKPKE